MNYKTSRPNNINFALSIQDSFMIKGVAICFLLWHHLFYIHPEYGRLVQYTALLGKVCVAMFVFISSYGLTVITELEYNTHKNGFLTVKGLFKFYLTRLTKLYVSFWFVFLIFVPLGVYVFNRSLIIPYGVNHTFMWLLFDFFGFAGLHSYNVTWWFYQLIIILYFFFPFLYIITKKWNITVLLLSFLLLGVHRITIPIVHDWLFVFALGISWALNKNKITLFLNQFNYKFLVVLSLIFLLLIAFIRIGSTRFSGIRIDGFFTLACIFFLILTVRKAGKINVLYQYLGKHSMNIFMIHTFIFYYFYSDFIYSFKFPMLIFLILLCCSLCISILIEYLKNMLRIFSYIKNQIK